MGRGHEAIERAMDGRLEEYGLASDRVRERFIAWFERFRLPGT